MEWEFMLPVKLVFGNGKRKEIEKYIDILGGKNGVLVCGKSFTKKPVDAVTCGGTVSVSSGSIIAILGYIAGSFIVKAREKMAEASIVAGVAFSHPRTTGSHACSFPLTNIYGLPHGEACAFTLDYFLKFNAEPCRRRQEELLRLQRTADLMTLLKWQTKSRR